MDTRDPLVKRVKTHHRSVRPHHFVEIDDTTMLPHEERKRSALDKRAGRESLDEELVDVYLRGHGHREHSGFFL